MAHQTQAETGGSTRVETAKPAHQISREPSLTQKEWKKAPSAKKWPTVLIKHYEGHPRCGR